VDRGSVRGAVSASGCLLGTPFGSVGGGGRRGWRRARGFAGAAGGPSLAAGAGGARGSLGAGRGGVGLLVGSSSVVCRVRRACAVVGVLAGGRDVGIDGAGVGWGGAVGGRVGGRGWDGGGSRGGGGRGGGWVGVGVGGGGGGGGGAGGGGGGGGGCGVCGGLGGAWSGGGGGAFWGHGCFGDGGGGGWGRGGGAWGLGGGVVGGGGGGGCGWGGLGGLWDPGQTAKLSEMVNVEREFLLHSGVLLLLSDLPFHPNPVFRLKVGTDFGLTVCSLCFSPPLRSEGPAPPLLSTKTSFRFQFRIDFPHSRHKDDSRRSQ